MLVLTVVELIGAITLDHATLLGIAAVVSAIGGIITTIVSARKAHREDEEKCVERLKAAREEGERLAAELHKAKMAHPEDFPDDPSPKEPPNEDK